MCSCARLVTASLNRRRFVRLMLKPFSKHRFCIMEAQQSWKTHVLLGSAAAILLYGAYEQLRYRKMMIRFFVLFRSGCGLHAWSA
jgi:hypothetical protein